MINQSAQVVQTKLNLVGDKVSVLKPTNLSGRVVNGQITLTQAEKDKLKKQMLLKSQMTIFKQLYPDLVDKNTIKYPIDDHLIKKMPDLHGCHLLKDKPQLMDIIIEADEFENLLYIWEFFNNFSDFLEIPAFDLVELQASLNFTEKPEKIIDHFEEDIDSSQEITNDPL